jgi:uncharacterized protein (TIGR03000 family)
MTTRVPSPWFSLLIASVLVLTHCAIANGQAEQTVKVRLKVFDSNDPSKALDVVKVASNFVRDPVTKKPQFLENVVIEGPDKAGFYELKVSKGWLIEQLVIQINDPVREYNPAIITKAVSAADMTFYPAASRSTDEFGFQAYVAQLAAYKTLIAEILDIVPEQTHAAVAKQLREAFRKQLGSMSDLKARVPNATPDERLAARKQLQETLKAYGLPHAEDPVLEICSEDHACGVSCRSLNSPAPAKLKIKLPAEALLYCDGYATTSKGGERVLETPILPPGKDFDYRLTIAATLQGKQVVRTVDASVRAGHMTQVVFGDE